MNKSILPACFILFISLSPFFQIFAQSNEQDIFRGRVLTSTNNEPVQGAAVKLLLIDNNDVSKNYEARTGDDGRFSIIHPNVKIVDEEVVLSITHPDFYEHTFTFVAGEEKEQQFNLQPRELYIRIAGNITDITSGEPIELAAIQVLPGEENVRINPPIGTTTNMNGDFEFTFRFSAPFKLRFSHISYFTKEVTVTDPRFREMDIEMVSRSIEGEDIYVISDLISETQLKESSTIDRVTALDVAEVASMSAFDMVSTLREADVSTQSMNLQSVSTRGFNSGANPRFLQLTDGVDNVAPGLGFPIGNLMGASDLDIASIDLLVGSSSARYGPSAMNGVLLTNTKDPYITQGLSFSAKAGMHNFKFGGADPWGVEGENVYDLSLRYAKVMGEKLAYKITGTFISGADWRAVNYDNIGAGESWQTVNDASGYNGVNVYGDENTVLQQVGVNKDGEVDGTYAPVARTGYRETDLVNYDIATQKIAGSVHYKFAKDTQLKIEGRYGYTNTLYINESRVRLRNFTVSQIKSELIANDFYINGYTTSQNSGDSYNVNYLAKEMLSSAKSDSDWFRDYEIAFTRGIPIYNVPANSVKAARRFADSGITLLNGHSAKPKYEPGTPEFEEEANRLKSIYSYEEGAGIKDNSQLYHINTGYTINEILGRGDLEMGGTYRLYDLDSEGTIFPDTTGNKITNYVIGGFVDYKEAFINERLNMNVILRLDKNENFNIKYSSQIGFSYELTKDQYLHASYQNGSRFPTVREQFLNTSLGDARLMGGLSIVHNAYQLQENSITEQSAKEFEKAVADDLNSIKGEYSRPQAELNNLHILEEGILPQGELSQIKPEKFQGFEFGFRQLFTPELYLDINYFLSFYQDFIGIRRFIKTRTSPSEDIYLAAGQMNSSLESDRYYVYSNANNLITAQGISFDLKYNSGNFMAALNGTWSNLIKDANDPIIPGYNTPPLKFNFEWGNRKLIENVGFKMIFRGRSTHGWQSPFLDGEIEGYGHFDFQFTIRIPSINASIKSGVTNLGILPYYDTYGGPEIGSFLFTTFTFNQ